MHTRLFYHHPEELLQRVDELLAAAADVGRRRLDRQLARSRRPALRACRGPGTSPASTSACACAAALGEPALDEQDVEPLPHRRTIAAIDRAPVDRVPAAGAAQAATLLLGLLAACRGVRR